MNNNLIPAATVLVLRDSDDGMEVLMVKRSKRPPFENLYVFPGCLLYTSPSPRDKRQSRMPSSA